jgi:hypothetical protein
MAKIVAILIQIAAIYSKNNHDLDFKKIANLSLYLNCLS